MPRKTNKQQKKEEELEQQISIIQEDQLKKQDLEIIKPKKTKKPLPKKPDYILKEVYDLKIKYLRKKLVSKTINKEDRERYEKHMKKLKRKTII